ncbi:translocation/assembly module TamB domain-containing protein [Luteimonas pelagia]
MRRIFRRRKTIQDMSRAEREAREARIAGLRARRIARAKVIARRSAFTGFGLTLLVLVIAWWLLGTLGGRDFLLAQIQARLPSGASLQWSRAEGPARGPLVLHDVRLVLPRKRDPACVDRRGAPCEMGEIHFDARRVMIDPMPLRLLGRTLRLSALEVDDARLDLPVADKPFELPEWPGVLPDIAPPLGLRADDIDIDRLVVTREGAPLIDIDSATGALHATEGWLQVRELVVDSDRGRFTADGEYAPRDDYRTDFTGAAVLPAALGRTPARIGLVARGDIAKMDIGIAGNAPGPLRATLVLRGEGEPRWNLRARADAFDPTLFAVPSESVAGDAPPWVVDLRADGVGGDARVEGDVRRGEFAATIRPSRVRIVDQVLALDPLRVDLMDGTVVARGEVDLREETAGRVDLRVDADGIAWRGAGDAPPVVADADVAVTGSPDAWTLDGTGRLVRGELAADVSIDGRGNREGVRLSPLVVRTPQGRLDAEGTLRWSPSPGWDVDARLSGFDPGWFFAGWDGAINGALSSTAQTRRDGGLDITVVANDLGGQLRGRPLDGHGRVLVRGAPPSGGTANYEGEVALSIGASRIDAQGRIADVLAVDARVSPLHLADLLPDAAGTLRGTLQLRGARTRPDVDVDLAGNGLRYGAFAAESLQASGRLPWRGRGGALVIRAQGVEGGVPFDTLEVDATGAMESLALDARARGELGALDLGGTLAYRGGAWQGRIGRLQLAPQRGPAWSLQGPADVRFGGGRIALQPTCLAAAGGGRLCAQADWPNGGLGLAGRELPLTLVAPWLPEREDGRPWLLRGTATLDARLRPVGNAWTGEATLVSADGGLRFSERARRDVIGWQSLRLGATFDPNTIAATLDASLFDGDPLRARIETGWDRYAPLEGSIAFDTDELTWMELFSPDIVSPTGQLTARIGLAGTRAQPAIGGDARLVNFATEIPALGINLTQGNLRMDALADGTARIDGSVRSGEGVLNVDGTLGWRGDDVPLVLHLAGTDVLVSDTRDLRAVANPDVTVRIAAGQPMEVTGTVEVPEATVDLERLDRGVSASPDVVVLDPVEPDKSGVGSGLAMDLTIVVGEDVVLRGFGLEGGLDGRLRVRQRPGREMVANGQLEIDGQYKAYGQDLEITRGILAWNGGPVSDPVLDIRAERDLGDVTAGIDVRGRASAPDASVWSSGGGSQSEALSFLALGRPLSSASGSERDQLNAASAALSAGSTLVASQLFSAIGLDDAGVIQSRTLGGSVFGIGKQLSPRLYVGYGVSLLGTGTVLTLKYLLGRGFDIEIESSSVENRASLNWRIER